MIVPQKLKVGDKIAIVSTARKITYEELKVAVELLESWGLNVVLGSNLFCEHHQFSGTIEQRKIDLQEMIDDEAIKAILCARGGYGTVQVIDKIDFTSLKTTPKWIIGYSDPTVLHSHLNRLGFASLHASMPINFSKTTKEGLETLRKALFGLKTDINFKSHKFNKLGEAKGEIVGGNLSILYSLLGSKSDIDTDGKILFLEDLDEYLYHIDRMMMNLKRNNKLANLKALIVGGMSDMNDNIIPFGKSAEEIILTHTKEYNYPICFGFPAGHINDNRCIRLGVKSTLTISQNDVSLSQE